MFQATNQNIIQDGTTHRFLFKHHAQCLATLPRPLRRSFRPPRGLWSCTKSVGLGPFQPHGSNGSKQWFKPQQKGEKTSRHQGDSTKNMWLFEGKTCILLIKVAFFLFLSQTNEELVSWEIFDQSIWPHIAHNTFQQWLTIWPNLTSNEAQHTFFWQQDLATHGISC